MTNSCKTRYFCPNCHQKQMLAYGEWLEDNVLAPVPHRQMEAPYSHLKCCFIVC